MRSFKTTLSCLKYTTNWSSMINEFCSHDKTLISFEIFLFLVHSDRSFLCDVCLICCELFKSGLIFKIMYKKQQQFVSCTICDHDEMKCYWSPMVDMTVRALHPNMLVYNNTIVKDDSLKTILHKSKPQIPVFYGVIREDQFQAYITQSLKWKRCMNGVVHGIIELQSKCRPCARLR